MKYGVILFSSTVLEKCAMKIFIQQIEKFNVLENRKKEYALILLRIFWEKYDEIFVGQMDRQRLIGALALNKKVIHFVTF